jgi:hypothetical protein
MSVRWSLSLLALLAGLLTAHEREQTSRRLETEGR